MTRVQSRWLGVLLAAMVLPTVARSQIVTTDGPWRIEVWYQGKTLTGYHLEDLERPNSEFNSIVTSKGWNPKQVPHQDASFAFSSFGIEQSFAIKMEGRATVLMTWIGQGDPPKQQFVAIQSVAKAIVEDPNGTISLNNGIGTAPNRSLVGPAIHKIANGITEKVFLVKNRKILFDVPLKAVIDSGRFGSKPSEATVSVNVAPGRRALSLALANGTTYRRGPGGIATANTIEGGTVSRIDTALTRVLKNHREAGYGEVKFSIKRKLAGDWSVRPGGIIDADKITHEWRDNFGPHYFRDSFSSEYNSVDFKWRFGSLLSRTKLEDFRIGPHLARVTCRVTDEGRKGSRPSDSATDVYVHLPYEITSEEWKPSLREADLTKLPELKGLYAAKMVFEKPNLSMMTREIKCEYEGSHSAKSTNSLRFLGSVASACADIQIGPDYTGRSGDPIQFTSTSSLAGQGPMEQASHNLYFGPDVTTTLRTRVSVSVGAPPGYGLRTFLVPIGDVRFPVISVYGPNGFIKDIKGFIVVPRTVRIIPSSTLYKVENYP